MNAVYPYVRDPRPYRCPDDASAATAYAGWSTTGAGGAVTAPGMVPALAGVPVGYGANEALLDSNPHLSAVRSPATTFLVADCGLVLSRGDDRLLRGLAGGVGGGGPERPAPARAADAPGLSGGLDRIPDFDQLPCVVPLQPAWAVFARHSGGDNVCFIDGHARWLPVGRITIPLLGVTGSMH